MTKNCQENWLKVLEQANAIFTKKLNDYGTSWSIMRVISLIDQLYIKALRIKTLSQTSEQKVNNLGDDIDSEYLGIVNYGIIGLIQIQNPQITEPPIYLTKEFALDSYNEICKRIANKFSFDYQMINGASEKFLLEAIIERLTRIKKGYQSGSTRKDNEEQRVAHHLEKIISFAIFCKTQRS